MQSRVHDTCCIMEMAQGSSEWIDDAGWWTKHQGHVNPNMVNHVWLGNRINNKGIGTTITNPSTSNYTNEIIHWSLYYRQAVIIQIYAMKRTKSWCNYKVIILALYIATFRPYILYHDCLKSIFITCNQKLCHRLYIMIITLVQVLIIISREYHEV